MKRKWIRSISFLFAAAVLPMAMAPVSTPGRAAQTQPLVSVYFPNWNVFSQDLSEVKHLPWNRVDRIYHAFWKIVRNEKGYAIVSTDPWADIDPGNPQAHFPQYAKYTKQYPHVEVLLSIGGWTRSGLFSEMALTRESRASFIDSCVETIRTYPFLGGIDLDWEYPGIHRNASAGDEGSPVAGDDWTNYPLLLRELRSALDDHFGPGEKKLTVCAPASAGMLNKQDYRALHPYVDAINLMTYDVTSGSSKITGHHSPLYGDVSADAAVRYMEEIGVPRHKVFIGTPLYNHGWRNVDITGKLVGASASGVNHGGDMLWKTLSGFESQAVPEGTKGWHIGYDDGAQAAYLWNDDPNSSYYRNFLTYESSRSLAAKLDYIRKKQIGGIIVWQTGGDDAANGFPMISQMYHALHTK